MTACYTNERDLAGEALVLKTMAQGHSLECAWKAVFPSATEMLEPPKCIDELVRMTFGDGYAYDPDLTPVMEPVHAT
ncbi:MAG: hypothetical protein HOL45_12165 [Chloroflexi bacterium]|nr:hypothetical protein [Chloroflexota bacterium]